MIFNYNLNTGKYSDVLDFNGDNGAKPNGTLMQASDGNIYGMTTFGGTAGKGVMFEYEPQLKKYLKILDFTGKNGAYPLYTSLLKVNTEEPGCKYKCKRKPGLPRNKRHIYSQ